MSREKKKSIGRLPGKRRCQNRDKTTRAWRRQESKTTREKAKGSGERTAVATTAAAVQFSPPHTGKQ
jgi:hypothetical protein